MGLSKWYPLTQEAVDIAVQREIGAYALSRSDGDARTIHYVGRDDKNVRRRLGEHVSDGKYGYFRFTHVGTVKEGYELECRLYHHFRPVDNKKHPDVPDGIPLRCPKRDCPN